MYDYPFPQAAPLVNAFLQTLFLLLFPLVIASIAGGSLGLWLFFRRHPLLSRSAKPRPAGTKALPCLRSLWYLGLMPMLLLWMQRTSGMAYGTAAALLLSLGATAHLTFHVYGAFYAIDESTLEMALASGLSGWGLIRRVLIPLGKNRLLHTLCETALFLLAMGSVAGCAVGGGLTGLALRDGLLQTDGLTWFLCLLLLAFLFFLVSRLSFRFAQNAEK